MVAIKESSGKKAKIVASAGKVDDDCLLGMSWNNFRRQLGKR